MLTRSLIVFLLVLNLGVAAWWIFHVPAAPPPDAPLPLGVARIQLPGENGATPAPAIEVDDADAGVVSQCMGFGPFEVEALAAARAVLEPRVIRVVPRRQEAGATRGWRVYLPPFASLDAVEQAARDVAAAGVSDYFIVRDGIEANSLALGRYGTEDAAGRRVSELGLKGFDARAMPIGSGAVEAWLDVEANDAFDADRAQADSGAATRHAFDCPSPD